MKNKILVSIIVVASVLMLASVVLTKCGILSAGEAHAAEDGEVEIINNVEDLDDGCLYIWKNCEGKKITAKDNEFILCPEGESNIDYDDRRSGSATYTVWVDSKYDKQIPTLTSSDKLLFISKKTIPDTFEFLRFYENGYSIGVTSLMADESGHYYAQAFGKEIYDYINRESDAAELKGVNVDRLYLDKVGGEYVNELNVSESGVVTGLKKDEDYVCEFYTGTYFQDYKMKADQHTFTAFEDFECHGYSFLHSNCIAIDIPEWLCSGYYYLNGEALFRYVDDSDVKAYNGKPYDANIDWNDPLIIYNELGQVIYDPSKEQYQQYMEEPEMEEDANDALDIPMGNTATWTYKVAGDEAFCAVVNVTPLDGAEKAILKVTAPDGEETVYEESDDYQLVVNLAEPQEGEYTFTIENITGRTFSVLYSTGDTYFGQGE